MPVGLGKAKNPTEISDNNVLTLPDISMPISSNTWLTTASCSSSSPDSSSMESSVSLTIREQEGIHFHCHMESHL